MGSDSGAATVNEFPVIARDNHTIVMAAEIWHVTDRLERILPEDKRPSFQTLESAEYLQDVLAIVARRHRLAVDADFVEPLDRLPCRCVEDQYGTSRRFLMQFRDEHFGAVDGKGDVKRTRRLARPAGILHVGDPLPVARIRIGAIEHAHAVLL